MSRFNYTSALGDNLPPNAPKKEYIATEALIGAGIGVASLAGSLYSQYQNLKSQADTNETNYKIHQEDLAYQREAWRNSQLENRYLVDQAYERNLPKNVVKNLEEAGINPAFAFNSGAFGSVPAQVGNAPSPSSVPSSHPMVAPQLADLGAGISDAANLYYMMKRNESDMAASRQHINNETLDTISKVDQRKFQNGEIEATMNKILQDIRFNNDNWDERSRALQLANDSIEADLTLKQEQAKYQRLINAFTPKEQEKILKKLDKELDEIVSRIRSNDADSAYKAAVKALTEAQEDGVKMDNATKQEIAGSLVAQESAKADKEDFEAQMAGRKYYKGEFFGTKTTGADANNNPINFRGNRSYKHRVLRKDGSGKYIFGFKP